MAAVLVHIDLDGHRPHPSSVVALAAGRQLASSWGATLYAAVIVHAPDEKSPPLADTETLLARTGADKIVVATTDGSVAPLWATLGHAWQGIVDHVRPRVVLFGADAPAAAELAPRTGARIGARLLMRARTLGGDDVELRDRDGACVRIADSGAAVALIGRAEPQHDAAGGDTDIDLVVLALPGGADPRVELGTSTAAAVAHTTGALVALGNDALKDKKTINDAKKLAAQLGAALVGTKVAGKTVPASAVVDQTTPLAPDLCVAIGDAQLEVSGATSVVRVGAATTTKGRAVPADGVVADVGVRELVKLLGDAP